VATVAGPAGAIGYSGAMALVVWGVSAWAFRCGYRGGLPAALQMLRGAAWRRVVVGAECAGAILLGVITAGPVAAALACLPADTWGGGQGVVGRALGTLPAVSLVLTFLAVHRWWLHERALAAGCYAIGMVVAVVRFL